MKTVGAFMTESPHSVASGQSLKWALDKMKQLDVRHLPVMEGGRLIGMLSERDIRFIESFEKLSLEELKVSDAFTDDPFTVQKDFELKGVCSEMAEKKLSSAMVVENGQLIGIFTWVDALKALAQNS